MDKEQIEFVNSPKAQLVLGHLFHLIYSCETALHQIYDINWRTFSYLWLVFHTFEVMTDGRRCQVLIAASEEEGHLHRSSRFTTPSEMAFRTPSPASFSLP